MGKLSDPLKSPVINIYNINTELVASSEKGITPGVSVVSMTYKYSDEDDDECSIKIQASHNDWLDMLDLYIDVHGKKQDAKVLYLSWGYIGGPSTSRRTVVVRDMKSKYGPNAIWTTLICSDFTTYLKTTQSPFIEQISPIDYIRKHCTGVVNIIIKVSGKLLYTQGIDERLGKVNTNLEVTVFDKRLLWDYTGDTTVHFSQYYSKGIRAKYKATEEVVPVGKWYDIEDDAVKEFLEKERHVNTISKSPYAILMGVMHKAPFGPWFISGRDNTLIIHNRGLSGNAYKYYVYNQEPGYLIDFTVETKYENFIKRSISYNNLDPETKKAKFLEGYIKALLKTRSPKQILESNESDEDKQEKLEAWLALYQGSYQNLRTEADKYEITAKGKLYFVDSYRSFDPTKDTKHKLLNPLVHQNYGPSDFVDLSQVIQDGIYYTSPISDLSENSNVVTNAARKLAMEKEEAKMTIEGDPLLKSDIIVGIRGVQKVHQGNYYIKVCSHILSSVGYKVNLEAFKIVSGTSIEQHITDEGYTIETITIDGEEKKEMKISHKDKYFLEQKLFEIKVKLKHENDQGPSLLPGQEFPDVSNPEVYIDFKEFLETHTDKPMKELIKNYKEGRVKFNVNTEDR